MKCPHCKKEIQFIAPVELNCEIYRKQPKGMTKCCGNIVQIRRKISFEPFIPYNHDELGEDNWGNKKIKYAKN